MAPKSLATVLLIAGVLLFVVALAADSLGLGAHPGLGAKQAVLAAVGVAVAAVGTRMLTRGRPKSLATVLLIAGVLLFLVALAADSLGLGAHPGLGTRQAVLAAVGVAVAAVGTRTLTRGRPKSLATVLLIAGVLLFLVALAADSLGLGAHPGLGARQAVLAAVGVAVAAGGMRMLTRGR